MDTHLVTNSRLERRRQMRERCADFLSPAFAQRVARLLHEPDAGACAVEAVRLNGTRFTLRCRLASGTVVYAKAYRGRTGRLLFGALRELWDAGFNDAGPFRVPEPLAFLEDQNAVLMGEARGAPLAQRLAEEPWETARTRVRAAARWLVALHSARLSCLEQEGPCERSKVLKESDVLVKAAAARPELAPALRELLACVHELAQASASPVLTPTHGQFTPSTALVDSDSVAAIDLDTVSLSDPAKDVATFVSKLKYRELFKAGGEPVRAARLANEFLDEYARSAAANLRNLSYYLALYCLKEFAKSLEEEGAHDRAERLCRMEINRCLGEGAPQRSLPQKRAATVDAMAAWSALCANRPEARAADVSVVQAKHTARLTLRLTTHAGVPLYAKWYPDHLGRRCARVAAALAAAGFGSDSPYRVPEVAAFVPDRTVLLMSAAEGVPLSELLETGDPAETVRGARKAARWLAALHRSPVRVGRPEREWMSLKVFRVPARLIEVCARFPDDPRPWLDIVYQLKHCTERLEAAPVVAQTHGSYRPKHVFIGDGVTTAIDLDRSLPADPAKDAAEFVADLRSGGFDRQCDRGTAEQAAAAFLEEYLSQAPDLAARVACYSACYLTLRLLKSTLRAGMTDPERFESYREAIATLCSKRRE